MFVVGAYPDPDPQVMELLTEKFSPPVAGYYPGVQTQELVIRYHLFFKHLFDTVRENIPAPVMSVPRVWQRHLLDEAINQGEAMSNREALYQDVVNRVKGDKIFKGAREVHSCPF